MEFNDDELTKLLQAAADEGEIDSNSTTAMQKQASDEKSNVPVKLAEEAYDSSDEEDMQNFFEKKYNEYGSIINTMLKSKDAERVDTIVGNEVSKSDFTFGKRALPHRPTNQPKRTSENLENNVYTDPIFGMRLIQPLISSTTLRERMLGRHPVEIRSLQTHLQNADLSKDWCISGVIVSKGSVTTSNAGSQYVIWRLSDLKGEMKTVSLFLFKSAYKELWKTAQGMIICVLNPSVFSRKDNNGESSLSIDSPRVMILGRSKDFGICKAKKKNGEPCTAVVNLGVCEFCVYHVKQEYGKMSGRSELQSATSGRGLQALRNKVLGKNEIFYGGKSFLAESAKPSQKIKAKDQQRLMSLSDAFKSSPLGAATTGKTNYLSKNSPATSRIAERVETNSSQRMKDLDRLKSLNVDITALKSTQSSVELAKSNVKQNQSTILNSKPSLSRESFSFTIGKTFSVGKSTKDDRSKAKAIAILQKKPIEKANPNFIKYRGTEIGKKRAHSSIESPSDEMSAQKKQKLAEEVEKFRNDRIKQLLAARSSHADLIETHDANIQNQYFTKLEKKEAMEEKMLGTTKMECKAVICLQCKYKAFSAAQRCKDENHKLKVVDAEKRFYECEDCGNRTITLTKLPKTSCTNCQSSRWKRTGMIRDKTVLKSDQPLSIRGDEETFIGGL